MSDNFVVVGIGNVLECDDGVGVYSSIYLDKNYTFEPDIKIVNGGVEGIRLLNLLMQTKKILILDAISIEDKAGSIYHIPSSELTGYGIGGGGGAHEIGILQCFDILELQGKEIPEASILAIIPEKLDFKIDLSKTLKESFDGYINSALNIITNLGYKATKKDSLVSLEEIISKTKDPQSYTT